MKLTAAILIAVASLSHAAKEPARYESLRQEIRQAVARGNDYLKQQQKSEGFWDDGQLPAFTALALNAAVRDPNLDKKSKLPVHLDKGFTWLLAQQKEDGGIYNRGLSTYNTATSLTALVAADVDAYKPAIVKARKHLIGNQWDKGEKGKTDEPGDGGVGYGAGSDRPHNDLSNTYLAIEALALSKKVVEDGEFGDQPDLDWKAALTFLSRCQNLPGTNDQKWASDDAQNKGGFIYNPASSKAGEDQLGGGRTALRSYGSISYAGLLSLIYAKLGPNDERVVAVKEWLGKNYTVEENPGMGPQGLYYYYQAMSKALGASGIDKLKLANGNEADWRNDLTNKLLSLQKGDGSWANENGKWMESNPVLVTAYTVLALEHIYDSIP
jgi:squalene-hopene/tetraprenyl-beta-curcumene cyclase